MYIYAWWRILSLAVVLRPGELQSAHNARCTAHTNETIRNGVTTTSKTNYVTLPLFVCGGGVDLMTDK